MVKHAVFLIVIPFMQGTLLNGFDINGILPNFTLIYLLYAGFFFELYTALVFAVILGALIDMSGTFPTGTTVVIYALLVFVINYLSTYLDFRNLSSWLVSVFVGTSLIYFSYYLVSEMIFEFSLSLQQVAMNFVIQLLYNLAVTLLFYPVLKMFENSAQRSGSSENPLEI